MYKKKKISMKVTVALLVLAAVVISILISIWNVMPIMKKSIVDISESYMQDTCSSKRDLVEQQIVSGGKDSLTEDVLEQMVGDTMIADMSSSYIYVVDNDGTMLYHPTADKIGKNVENSVVTGLVNDIIDGKHPQDLITKYDYNGESKYAVCCMTSDNTIIVFSVNEDEVLAPVTKMFIRNIAAGIFILLVLLPFTVVFSSRITKSISSISNTIMRASELNFKEAKDINKICKRRDEAGDIARSFCVLRSHLGDMIKCLQDGSTHLKDASDRMTYMVFGTKAAIGQVDAAIGEVAQGASQQAGDAEDVSSEVAVMGNKVEDVNSEVNEVTSKSSEMLKASENAMEILENLKDINSTVSEQIKTVGKQTAETNNSVNEIREATNLITEITSQTNLLALNASIEAARAGEAGKGFAVVANEIKALSEQCDKSAGKIQQTVEKLLNDSMKVVDTMDNVHQSMQIQMDKVAETDEKFKLVKRYIDSSADNITEISNTANEIDKQRSIIIDVVNGLSAIAQQNAAAAEETSSAIQDVGVSSDTISKDAKNLAEEAAIIEERLARFVFE